MTEETEVTVLTVMTVVTIVTVVTMTVIKYSKKIVIRKKKIFKEKKLSKKFMKKLVKPVSLGRKLKESFDKSKNVEKFRNSNLYNTPKI